MNKLQRIEEMERQLAALKDEVVQEARHKQWDPEGGVFLCHHTGFIADSNVEDLASKINGCTYKTEKQAEKAASAMRTHNRLLAYVAEFDSNYRFEFGKRNWAVHSKENGTFTTSYISDLKIAGAVYMSEDAAKELCRKLNSGEVVL